LGMDLKMGMAAIACERWPCNHRHSMGIWLNFCLIVFQVASWIWFKVIAISKRGQNILGHPAYIEL
jgi:hypothetical protein